MAPPKWEMDTEKGRAQMREWLAYQLNQVLNIAVAEQERNADAALAELAGRQACQKQPEKRGRGRPTDIDARIRRSPDRYLAEIVVPQIKELWRSHYGKSSYSHQQQAIEFAVEWFWGSTDLVSGGKDFRKVCDQVDDHLRRGNRRLFE